MHLNVHLYLYIVEVLPNSRLHQAVTGSSGKTQKNRFYLLPVEYPYILPHLVRFYRQWLRSTYRLCSFSPKFDSIDMRRISMAASFGCATKGVSM